VDTLVEDIYGDVSAFEIDGDVVAGSLGKVAKQVSTQQSLQS